MKKKLSVLVFAAAGFSVMLACNSSSTQTSSTATAADSAMNAKMQYGGFASQAEWGAHLVLLGGCNDCHTPKKMGPMGPVNDSSLLLSGHPSKMPPPPLDVKEAAAKGMAATQTLTAWVGPWGTSYAYNLTPDSTGLGTWTEAQFLKCIKENKFMGLDNSRPLLPPMPVESMSKFSDDELKAIFAYLRSIPPVHNVVPASQPLPPPTAAK